MDEEKPDTIFESGLCGGARGRGRPRAIAESERRQKLIDAAEHVFVEMGYSAASVDDIAHRAAMSKKTIYQLFETKGELFAAVIASRRAELAGMIGAQCCDDAVSLEYTLHHFLKAVASFVLAPRQAALYRLVIAESHREPELAHAFYCEGPIKGKSALTDWLALQHRLKTLDVPDAPVAATMLFSMVIYDLQMRLLIGEIEEPAEAIIEDRVNTAVKLFLDGARLR